MVKKVLGKKFDEVMAKDMALIDFSAVWCGPCKMVAPVLEEISEEMSGDLDFYNVDVDENPDLAQQFNVVSIPALALVKNGKLVDMQVGFRPKNDIVSFIKSNM